MYNSQSTHAYLISYDLNKPGQDYESLYKAIKGCSSYWTHVLDSVWIIKSSLSADVIRDRILAVIDKNDSILVIQVTNNYSGWLTKELWDHLSKVTS